MQSNQESNSFVVPKASMVVAHDKDMVIGVNGQIPWHCADDLKFFYKLTRKNIVIMGRKTFDSLPKKPLMERINIVLSKKHRYNRHIPHTDFTSTEYIRDYIAQYHKMFPEKEFFVIGGAEIYTHFLAEGLIGKIYVTEFNHTSYVNKEDIVIKCPPYYDYIPNDSNYKMEILTNKSYEGGFGYTHKLISWS